MNHFSRRNPLFPFVVALAVVLLSLVCFDAYRLTHAIWIPAFVVFPFAALVGAFCWSWQQFEKDRRAKHPNPARVEITLEEGVWMVRTPIALGEDAKEALEWVGAMPNCIKEQLREANQFAQMMKE